MTMSADYRLDLTADASAGIAEFMRLEAKMKQLMATLRKEAKDTSKSQEEITKKLKEISDEAIVTAQRMHAVGDSLKALQPAVAGIPPLKVDSNIASGIKAEVVSAVAQLAQLQAGANRAEKELNDLARASSLGKDVSEAQFLAASRAVITYNTQLAIANQNVQKLTGSTNAFGISTQRSSMAGMQFAYMVDDMREAFAQGGGLPQVIRATGNNITAMLAMLGGPWIWAGIAGLTALQLAFGKSKDATAEHKNELIELKKVVDDLHFSQVRMHEGERAATEEKTRAKEDEDVKAAESKLGARLAEENVLRQRIRIMKQEQAQLGPADVIRGAIRKRAIAADEAKLKDLQEGFGPDGKPIDATVDLQRAADATRQRVAADRKTRERQAKDKQTKQMLDDAVGRIGKENLAKVARKMIGEGKNVIEVGEEIAMQVEPLLPAAARPFARDVGEEAVAQAQGQMMGERMKEKFMPETPAQKRKREVESELSKIREKKDEIESQMVGGRPTGMQKQTMDKLDADANKFSAILRRIMRDIEQEEEGRKQRERNVPAANLEPLPMVNHVPFGG